MAHFAQLDGSNTVVQVVVVNNDAIDNLAFPESEPVGIVFCQSIFGADTEWKQTSYNGNFRRHYAGVGFTFNDARDAFIAPQPYPSWSLDDATCEWVPPVPRPTDGNLYVWDESTLSWVKI